MTAEIEATASFRHLRLAFLRTSSEQILSDNLVKVQKTRVVVGVTLFY